jgi:hypothetical protein
VWIGPEGRVADRFLGEGHDEAIDRRIGQLLDQHARELSDEPLPIARGRERLA